MIFTLAVIAAAGCGGGGTTPPPPVTPTADPPVQSGWSPASGSIRAHKAFTITFQTNVTATCRWSLSDAGYDSMGYPCLGSGSTSHSCSVSGLNEGAATVFTACTGMENNPDTAATNKHLAYTIDTINPTIQITAPAGGSSWYTSEPPATVAVSYADTGSGADPATLEVTFTLQGRTLELTDLFGRDPVANASGSQSDPANDNPLSRTSLARFDSTDFETPDTTWTVDRCGYSTQHIDSDGSDAVYIWDTECEKVWMIKDSTNARAEIELSGAARSAAGAPGAAEFYASVEDSARLYSFSANTGDPIGSISLPDFPTALSYNSANGYLYIAYATRAEIGVYNCISGTLLSAIPAGITPDFLAAWPTADGEVLALGWQFNYRLQRIDAGGMVLNTIEIGPQLPKGLAIIASYNSAYATRYAEGDVRAVNMLSGASSDIDVGSLPTGVFTSPTEILAINAGDRTISIIGAGTQTVIRTVALRAPATGGAFLNGNYYLLEDVWQVSPSASLTINATIRDRAGNSGAGSVTITVQPETPG